MNLGSVCLSLTVATEKANVCSPWTPCLIYKKLVKFYLARYLKELRFVGSTEAVVQRCSVKNVFYEISQNSQENTFAKVSFLMKLQTWPATFLKKRLAQVFSCEFCEFSNDIFFHRTPPVAAST